MNIGHAICFLFVIAIAGMQKRVLIRYGLGCKIIKSILAKVNVEFHRTQIWYAYDRSLSHTLLILVKVGFIVFFFFFQEYNNKKKSHMLLLRTQII